MIGVVLNFLILLGAFALIWTGVSAMVHGRLPTLPSTARSILFRTEKPKSTLWTPQQLAQAEHDNLGTDVFGDPIDRKEWGLDPWGHGSECVICHPPSRLCPDCRVDTIDGSRCSRCAEHNQRTHDRPGDIYLGNKFRSHAEYVKAEMAVMEYERRMKAFQNKMLYGSDHVY